MSRLGRILSVALITAGLVVLADVGITLAYKEPLSSIYSSIEQDEAPSRLGALAPAMDGLNMVPSDRSAPRGKAVSLTAGRPPRALLA